MNEMETKLNSISLEKRYLLNFERVGENYCHLYYFNYK